MLNKVVNLERDRTREMPDIGHDLPIFARGRLTLEPGEPDFFGVPANSRCTNLLRRFDSQRSPICIYDYPRPLIRKDRNQLKPEKKLNFSHFFLS